MNGLLNNNFLFGFLLSKDLPREEQVLVGLSAGQSRGPMAPVLLKPVIDERVNQETKRVAAEKRAEILASEIVVEVPIGTREVQLRVPAAAAPQFVAGDTADATLSVDGRVTFRIPSQANELSLAIVVDGVARPVVVKSKVFSLTAVAGDAATTRGANEMTRRPVGSTAARSASRSGSYSGPTDVPPRAESPDVEPSSAPVRDHTSYEAAGNVGQREQEPRGEQVENAGDQSARRKSR